MTRFERGERDRQPVARIAIRGAPEVRQAFALLFRHVIAVLLVRRRHGGNHSGVPTGISLRPAPRERISVVVADRVLGFFLRLGFPPAPSPTRSKAG